MSRPSQRDTWIAALAIMALVLVVYVATCNRPAPDWDDAAPLAVQTARPLPDR